MKILKGILWTTELTAGHSVIPEAAHLAEAATTEALAADQEIPAAALALSAHLVKS